MHVAKLNRHFAEPSPPQSIHKITCQGVDPGRMEFLFAKPLPWWKRCVDIIASSVGLIVLSPLFFIIGILIKTVSPGPVFFKQQRVGHGGKLFPCLKFRTMRLDADTSIHKDYLTRLIGSGRSSGNIGEPMQKIVNDHRIIKFGNFLRAAGMDELPQLINVFLGHMSLVGPRPPIPYEVEQYQHWYKTRFDVVPGLTGLWQVSGKNKLGFNEMIRLDIQYAMKSSILLDCKILLKTPYVVFRQVIEFISNKYEYQPERQASRR
jgi:lipopolysaccharide/colanic/teichoic acid biosynthesis glycosyltransferase